VKKVIVGNHAVSWGARLARVEVISAYPIPPQTQVVEELSEMCSDGRLAARFIKVESEHSAMAACIGASATGARAFTATSSQGLALMHEMLHWATGGRHPIVLANINRALGPGWNIWTDQTDSLSQRDTGWIQLYCETNQEVLDTTVQAFRLAESVDLPVMIVLDAFYLSHTAEPVDIPDQDVVDTFLPRREARYKLDVDDPHAFGALVAPDSYMEMRWQLQEAMDRAQGVFDAVDLEWDHLTGRRYGAIEAYRAHDADLLLVTSGTITSTARHVVDGRRERGEAIGLVKVKMFRPFPTGALREVLSGAALYDVPPDDRPHLYGYVLGLGGRDVTPDVIDGIVDEAQAGQPAEREDLWVGVNP
jgi:pyruvate/2-oxoacid:ferredoxin oxidoreductase alpha subunit